MRLNWSSVPASTRRCGIPTPVPLPGWINLQEAGIQIDRNELAATLLNELRQSLKQFEIDGLAPFIGRWRTLDNFIDRPVKLLIGERQIVGIARGIDSQGRYCWNKTGR